MSNQTTEGFLSSILNDDDLQLMDMAMNEGRFYLFLKESLLSIQLNTLCERFGCSSAYLAVGTIARTV